MSKHIKVTEITNLEEGIGRIKRIIGELNSLRKQGARSLLQSHHPSSYETDQKRFQKAVKRIKMLKKLGKLWNQNNVMNDPALMKTNVKQFVKNAVLGSETKIASTQARQQSQVFDYSKTPLELSTLEKPFKGPYNQPGFTTLSIGSLPDKARLAWTLLSQFQAADLPFKLGAMQFLQFFSQLEFNYNKRKNPFHNIDHGLSVMHCAHVLQKGQLKTKFSPTQRFYLLLSSLCHDVDHTGRTNLFEINSDSKLALLYNDNSVLENHHVATTFKILRKQENLFLKEMKRKDYVSLRKWVTKLILSTDNQSHFKLYETCQKLLLNNSEDSMSQEGNRMEVAGLVLHCCDFAGITKSVEDNLKWCKLVNQEFTNQFRKEIELNLTPTPYFKDLDVVSVRNKNEVGFVTAIVQPIWNLLKEYLGQEVEPQSKNIEAYLAYLKA